MLTTGNRKPGITSMILILTTTFSVVWTGCAPHPLFVMRAMSADCAPSCGRDLFQIN